MVPLGHLLLGHRMKIQPQLSAQFMFYGVVLIGFPFIQYGDGSKPISIIFSGMNIHLPAIFMFTRGTRFWHTAIYPIWNTQFGDDFDLHWSALSWGSYMWMCDDVCSGAKFEDRSRTVLHFPDPRQSSGAHLEGVFSKNRSLTSG